MPGRCVAGRPTVPIPIPTLIVKAGSPAYPGLAANEFLCLQAARRAGIRTPAFDLSHDGQLLLLVRFDIEADGQRLGFEDIASLMGLRVRDTLSDRKYHGSYERVAEVLRLLRLAEGDLHRFFAQVAFSPTRPGAAAHWGCHAADAGRRGRRCPSACVDPRGHARRLVHRPLARA